MDIVRPYGWNSNGLYRLLVYHKSTADFHIEVEPLYFYLFIYFILLFIYFIYYFFAFICPCIASISLKYNQQDATFSRSIYFYKFLYMFQAVPPPIIRSTKLYIQRQLLSNQAAGNSIGLTISDAVCTVLCSWWWAEKPPETCTAIYRNK
jgi:hypothetical protein